MLLFCVKTVVKESHKFELAHLKKKNILAIWRLSGSQHQSSAAVAAAFLGNQ